MFGSRKLGTALACAMLALLPGCFEQKVTLELHSDRSGKLHLSKRLGELPNALAFLGALGDEEKDARTRRALTDELACWYGVSAWTNARSRAQDGGIDLEADAWFEDANALARSEPSVGDERFRAREVERGLELAWSFRPTREWRAGPFEDLRVRARSLDGLVIAGRVAMPGPITRSSAEAVAEDQSGRSFTLVSAVAIEREIQKLEERMASGELTREEAAALLSARYATREATFACRVTERAEELAAFRGELGAAKKVYDESELKREVEERRIERAAGAARETSWRR